MNELRSNETRAKVTIALILTVMLVNIVNFVFDVSNFELYKKIAAGAKYTVEEIENREFNNLVILMVYITVFVASAVAFIMWFRRAYNNIKCLGTDINHYENWTVISWFIPVLNLFRPYQIMREMYKKSDEYITSRDSEHKPAELIFVGWWWALWIMTALYGNIVQVITINAESLGDYLLSSKLFVLNVLLTVPLALCTIRVIKDYRKIEKKITDIHNNSAMPENISAA